ncbi:acetyl-coenzyme A synthetase [Pyrenophora tritici-repentis]|nr:acetyl-coenzyme A synthetase [Pyrenophora tritici-repentis]
MVLPEAQFEWFYDVGFPAHVHLRNISGGTDLAGRFGIGNPLTPVYAGGCQGPCLGMKVEVYDSLIESGPGVAVPDGEPGELVATASFPNQPIFFWGDKSGERYRNAYYTRFPHVWTHGDFIQIHPLTGQITFLGRADGVLNPSGIRFGSADIYSVIEQHFPEVADSLCVGQRRPLDNDETVYIFLKMNNGHRFREGLVERIKSKISQERSKRHVPQYIFQTWDIPVSQHAQEAFHDNANKSLDYCEPKKGRAAGQTDRLRQKIKASGTLANPESLKYYEQFARVEEVVKRLARDKQRRRRSTL